MIEIVIFVAFTALFFTALYFYGEKEKYKQKYTRIQKLYDLHVKK